MHLHLNYGDRIIQLFGISLDQNTSEYHLIMQDLHSKNIVIHNSNAKITDFGISKDQNNQTSMAYIVTALGTPEEYGKLYKNCWNQEPEQRPTINEILNEFEKMGFGNNVTSNLVEDNDNLTSELQASAESSECDQLSSNLHIDWKNL
ncbi:unnamed protein product [Rhizophagus irregularis]|uniref:Protein kinase domain-containing protein n=1 Tax=Rhizophagus irregularis TaxID=588596 RepID=A0A916E118_9GLOM|nr:unnamed protein product [Rhizophagus irregularis]